MWCRAGKQNREASALVMDNQAMLRALFSNVHSSDLLAPEGELHVTLHRGAPYDSWNVVTLAKLAGLRVRSCTPFDACAFAGYTGGMSGAGARTYAFVKVAQREEVAAKKPFDGNPKEAKKQQALDEAATKIQGMWKTHKANKEAEAAAAKKKKGKKKK